MPTPGRDPGPARAPSQPAQTPPKAEPHKVADAPKPKSAKEDMHDALRKKAGVEEPPKPAEPPKAGEAKGAAPEGAHPPAGTAEKKDKPNPWKLYEAEKTARASVEQQLQQMRQGQVSENDRKSFEDRVTKAEARAKELEDHIRFVDYQKSEEFQRDHAKPLESAWQRAVEELSEIHITDPATNQPRPVTAQDIYELVHLPLDKAREIAKEVFGEFADDVMGHRKEIKGLLKKQADALETAKKNGDTRKQQQDEQAKTQREALTKEVSTRFNEYVAEVTADKVNGEFFTPRKPAVEGTELTPEEKEHNEALEGSWKRLNQWKSPTEQGITSEERASRLKLDIAMRHMAAAFPGMKKLIFRLRKERAEIEKQLAGYRQSTPPAGGSQPSSNGHQQGSARESLREGLRKLAH